MADLEVEASVKRKLLLGEHCQLLAHRHVELVQIHLRLRAAREKETDVVNLNGVPEQWVHLSRARGVSDESANANSGQKKSKEKNTTTRLGRWWSDRTIMK
jgi:hypothetical protein